ncbi:MAG: hypothetical protein KA239_12410 [Bacteroidia bacterium]|nr:hypothetical protein [Bacteroidia bacterium]
MNQKDITIWFGVRHRKSQPQVGLQGAQNQDHAERPIRTAQQLQRRAKAWARMFKDELPVLMG